MFIYKYIVLHQYLIDVVTAGKTVTTVNIVITINTFRVFYFYITTFYFLEKIKIFSLSIFSKKINNKKMFYGWTKLLKEL